MKLTFGLIAAGAMVLAPSSAFAVPDNSQGSTQGVGWDHLTGPAPGTTGQPFASCEDLGTTPGQSADTRGGGSPFSGEDSTSGSSYAGSQPQNSRNQSSVSQYDVACLQQFLNR